MEKALKEIAIILESEKVKEGKPLFEGFFENVVILFNEGK